MSEKKGYRGNLESILAMTKGRHWLTINDCRDWSGLDPRTIKRKWKVTKNGISAEDFARRVSSD